MNGALWPALWLVLFVAAWGVARFVIAHRLERVTDAKFARGTSGVFVGADPVRLEGTRRGAVLLLHGYNDSPQSVASFASELHARGWSVRVPLLPGHGRTLREFAASGAEQWLAAARLEIASLRSTHDEIALGGVSMGGPMSFLLAAEHPAPGDLAARRKARDPTLQIGELDVGPQPCPAGDQHAAVREPDERIGLAALGAGGRGQSTRPLDVAGGI